MPMGSSLRCRHQFIESTEYLTKKKKKQEKKKKKEKGKRQKQ